MALLSDIGHVLSNSVRTTTENAITCPCVYYLSWYDSFIVPATCVLVTKLSLSFASLGVLRHGSLCNRGPIKLIACCSLFGRQSLGHHGRIASSHSRLFTPWNLHSSTSYMESSAQCAFFVDNVLRHKHSREYPLHTGNRTELHKATFNVHLLIHFRRSAGW
jgi:hypothetical protein